MNERVMKNNEWSFIPIHTDLCKHTGKEPPWSIMLITRYKNKEQEDFPRYYMHSNFCERSNLSNTVTVYVLTWSHNSLNRLNCVNNSWMSGLRIEIIELSWMTIFTTSLCSATSLWRGFTILWGLIFTSSPLSSAPASKS